MEEKIQEAAAAFYKKKGIDSDASFIDYEELAKSAVAATKEMPLSGELTKMIEAEKKLLAGAYSQQNSALYIILNKLLEQRGVKTLSNMFKKTNAFTNNTVFSFEKPQVADPNKPEVVEPEEEEQKGKEEIKGAHLPIAEAEAPIAEAEARIVEEGTSVTGTEETGKNIIATARPVNIGHATRIRGGRTRSLLKRIRTLTKKNIRRMV